MQAACHVLPPLLHGTLGPAPHHHVRRGAGGEVADFVLEIEGARRASGGGVKPLPGRHTLALQRQHLVAIGQGAQLAQTGTAAHIARRGHAHACSLGFGPVEQAAAQKEVGRRREGDTAAGLRHALPVGIVEPDAMRQNAAAGEQTAAVIDVEVAAAVGKQLGDPAHFVAVFGHMRLHIKPAGALGVALQQATGHGQLGSAAGGGEARGHGVGQAVDTMPALDQIDAVLLSLHHIVAQVGRAVAVHQHLAGDEPHAQPLTDCEQRLAAGLVHRGEHQRRRGAVRQQRLQKTLGAQLAQLGVGVARFGREGVALQPVEQRRTEGGDDIELRRVHMGIDEARHHQMAAPVLPRPARVGGLVGGPHRMHPALLDQQPAVGLEAHGAGGVFAPAGVAQEVENVAAQGHASLAGGDGRGQSVHSSHRSSVSRRETARSAAKTTPPPPTGPDAPRVPARSAA